MQPLFILGTRDAMSFDFMGLVANAHLCWKGRQHLLQCVTGPQRLDSRVCNSPHHITPHNTTVQEHNYSTAAAQAAAVKTLQTTQCPSPDPPNTHQPKHQPKHYNNATAPQRHCSKPHHLTSADKPTTLPPHRVCPAYKKILFTLDSSMLCVEKTCAVSLGACRP